jgi:hypothetical protein
VRQLLDGLRGWRGRLAAAVALLALLRLLLVPLDHVTVAMDEARYLGLAASFPWHQLYGQDLLFVFHPPGYPWAIGALTLFAIPDHLAGVLVSALAAGVTCWLAYRVGRSLGFSRLAATLAPAFLLQHAVWLDSAAAVMRESLFGCLALGFVGACLAEIRSERRRMWPPGLFALGMVLVSDVSVLGFGALFACAAWCRLRGDQLYLARVGVTLVVPWVVWAAIKAQVYGGAAHLPVCVDGMIVDTTSFGWKQLYSPYFFPEHQETVWVGERGWTWRVWAFSQLQALRIGPWTVPWWGTAPLLLGAAYRCARRRRIQGNPELLLAGLALLFSLPTVMHDAFLPRFGAPATIFLALLLGQGGVVLTGSARWALRRGARGATRRLPDLLAALVLASGAAHVAGSPRLSLLFGLEKRVEAAAAAERLAALPGEGAVMAQLGYGQELAYQLERPVVALPVYPDRLEEWIEAYGVAWIVIGDHYFASPETGDLGEVWCAPTIAHVFAHPERFEQVARVEDASIPEWPDVVRIYRVR